MALVEFRGLVSSLRELIRVLKEMLVILKRQFPEPVDQTKLGKAKMSSRNFGRMAARERVERSMRDYGFTPEEARQRAAKIAKGRLPT